MDGTISEPVTYFPTDIQIRDLNVTLKRDKSGSYLQKIESLKKPSIKHQCDKTILDNLSADIKGGTLTAIVGGSGCGKTTFLSTISQRLTDKNLSVTGHVSYDGTPLNFIDHDRPQLSIPYVVQEDILIPQLSVQETLLYAAELRLPSMTRVQQQERVRQVIDDLRLTASSQRLVGDGARKGISGGEKRRTSVAVQMLTDSPILFLDEPTTGLDAASALQIVKVLKALATQGRTVVLTSTTVYSGPTANCLSHLKAAGYPISPFINPFEFILDVSTINRQSAQAELESLTRLDTLKKALLSREKQLVPLVQDSKTTRQGHSETLSPRTPSKRLLDSYQKSSLFCQVRVLTKRTWKVTYRDRLGSICSIIEAIVMGIVTGWIFYHVGRDLQGIRSRQGAMYTAAGLQAYLMLIFETYRLSIDIKVHDRECQEGVSSAASFVLSRRFARALLEDIPVPLIYSTIFYLMAGFRLRSAQFSIFFAVVYLMHITAMSVAGFCVALNREFLISSLIANTIFVMQSMTSGFFVNAANISIWLRWLKWASYLFYAFGALCYNEFAGQFYDCPATDEAKVSADCIQYEGEYILQTLDIPSDWLVKPIIAIVGFFVAFSALAILVLHYNTKVVRISAYVSNEKAAATRSPPSTTCEQTKRRILISVRSLSLSTRNSHFRTTDRSQHKIVSHISAEFESGGLHVIMGPSGSGKTTLLNFMARGAQDNGQGIFCSAGDVRFNNATVSSSVLRAISAYVPQDDEGHLPSLTVRETLHFAACMRLPKHTSDKQRTQRVNSLIDTLGLKDCAETLVGNELLKGISGGEKRRLSIGIHLLADPLVLFLDEPTSGLDSTTASSIIDLLDGIAKEGRVVIMSIHQPQSEWLKVFRTVLLLGPGACSIYSGAVGHMLKHFEQLGFDCPEQQNPADFVLDVITQNLQLQTAPAMNEIVSQKKYQKAEHKITEVSSETAWSTHISIAAHFGEHARQSLGFCAAFRLLLHRAFINMSRQPVLALGRMGQIVGLSFVLTCFFTPLKHDSASIQSRMGYVQQLGSLYFVGMLNAIAIYPTEREVFLREHSDRLYPVEAFLSSYTVLEIPWEIVGSIIFSLLTVLAVGLPRTIQLVFVIALNAFCVVFAGESLGVALMTICSHTGMAVTVCCIVMSICVHITGVIAIDMPAFLRGLNYLSPLKWMVGNVAVFSLRDVDLVCSTQEQLADGRCPIETGEQVLELYNLNVDAGKYLGVLVGIAIAYRMFAYLVLKLRTFLY